MSSLLIFFQKDKKLGVSNSKHRYDLPLAKSADSKFLVLLIALMTFLAMMAMSGTFVLSAMNHHWSSGLQNKITVEIPAEDDSGMLRNESDITELTKKISIQLQNNKELKNVSPLQQNDIEERLSPWLGDNSFLENIPMPGLITIEVIDAKTFNPKKLEQELQKQASNIRLDTHDKWLQGILRFTGALQTAAALIAIIIGITTITAIAGAIRSRISIYEKDVELLHLMGASDAYIAKQFQRHSLILSLQGALFGGAIGMFCILIVSLIAGDTSAALLPEFSMGIYHFLFILTLPFIICALSVFTTRLTVLQSLSLMP